MVDRLRSRSIRSGLVVASLLVHGIMAFPGPYNHFSVTERKPRISAGLGWKQSTDLTLLAGAGQTRSLRAVNGAIAHAQHPRPRPLRRRLERDADRALALRRQARHTGLR